MEPADVHRTGEREKDLRAALRLNGPESACHDAEPAYREALDGLVNHGGDLEWEARALHGLGIHRVIVVGIGVSTGGYALRLDALRGTRTVP